MLAEAEDGLVQLIKGSPLKTRVKAVDTLPDLEGESLVSRFATDAPAVYVAMSPFPVSRGSATLNAGIACVARNAGGHAAARKGDGMIIGMYQMMELVASLMEGADAGGATWEVVDGSFMADEKIYKAGLQVGVIRIRTAGEVVLPSLLDETALADFKTFHADYDVDPHEPAAEHDKWLQEPPDHSTSAPEVSETTTLQP